MHGRDVAMMSVQWSTMMGMEDKTTSTRPIVGYGVIRLRFEISSFSLNPGRALYVSAAWPQTNFHTVVVKASSMAADHRETNAEQM